MLKEIIDLAKFAKELLDSHNAKVKGWRRIYDLYLKLDTVIAASVTAVEGYLPRPLDAPSLASTTSFRSPLEKWVTLTNSDFEELDRAVKDFVSSFREVARVLEIYDPDLNAKLQAHFWMKSQWCRLFDEVYRAGVLTSDGKKMCQTALRIADRADTGRVRMGGAALRNLVVSTEIDIATAESKLQLVEAGRANIAELKTAQAKLGDYIRTNCKIEDLL